jgi:hypothetical protein
MKKLEVSNRDEARNERLTEVELAARVRLRAYKLYEEPGKTDGHALEDWEQAEAEILRRKGTITLA